MNKFWTDICLIPLAAAFVVGLLWCAHQGIHYQIKPVEPSVNLFNPVDGRDYGNMARACSRYVAKMSSNEVAIKMAEETKQALIKMGMIKNG
jgi:hypothetical protein